MDGGGAIRMGRRLARKSSENSDYIADVMFSLNRNELLQEIRNVQICSTGLCCTHLDLHHRNTNSTVSSLCKANAMRAPMDVYTCC